MTRTISPLLAVALSPTPVLAQSTAYDTGYASGSAFGNGVGEFLGQAVNQFGPYLGLLSLVVVVGALRIRRKKLSRLSSNV